jgi:hypothetical protein
MKKWWLGWVPAVLCIVLGVGIALFWTSFAAMYVPQCPRFSIHAEEAECRTPVLWVLGGYSLAAVGLLVLVAKVLGILRGKRREVHSRAA